MSPQIKELKGDCDCCEESKNVVLYAIGDGMMACESCKAKQDAATAQIKVATQVVEAARKQDDTIQLQSDIWTAATATFTELAGAIQQNPAIEDSDKRFELVREAVSRIQKFNKAIFDTKAALNAQMNERDAWVANTQKMVATLRADQQAKFKQFNVEYEPKVTKTSVKKAATSKSSKSPSTSSQKYSHKQVSEACAKAGADITMVRMLLTSNRSLTLEQAIGRYLETMK